MLTELHVDFQSREQAQRALTDLRKEYRIATGLPEAQRQRLAAFRPTLFHIAVPDVLGYQALKLAAQ